MKLHIETKRDEFTLRGYVNTPDTDNRHPAVLMFHGFTGHKGEGHFLFVQAADALEKAGFCVLRFDFAHSGESDGSFDQMTPSTQLADARHLAAFAKSLPYVDPERLSLIGLSFGGYIASLLAAELGSEIHKLVLWSPAGNIRAILEAPFAKNDLAVADIGGLLLSRAAYEDAARIDVYDIAKEYQGDVLIVHETGDATVPYEYGLRFKEVYGDRAVLYSIDYPAHTFNNAEIKKEAIGATADFLMK